MNKFCSFEFESGVRVHGVLRSCLRKEGKLLLLSFSDCSVVYQDQQLFDPSWGMYDMAVGESVVSAFTGPADANAFGLTYPQPAEKTHQIVYDERQKALHAHYGSVRSLRQKQHGDLQSSVNTAELIRMYPDEWLLQLEMLETALTRGWDESLVVSLAAQLNALRKDKPHLENLIRRGLSLHGL